jgi:hypothetical protein
MSNTPEEFEKLQKLLKVKRYEQPPPGFFNNFSAKVVNRIESADEVDQAWAQAPWLRKFFLLLETNPLAAGLFGLSVCGLMISGIAFSEYAPLASASNSTGSNLSLDVADAGNAAMPVSWNKTANVDSTAPSINPIFSTNVPGALFGFEQAPVQKVNFTVGQ